MIGVHIGTDAEGNRPYRNPGGALLNYLDTTFGGQKAAAQFVAGGALERHPEAARADLRRRGNVGAVRR